MAAMSNTTFFIGNSVFRPPTEEVPIVFPNIFFPTMSKDTVVYAEEAMAVAAAWGSTDWESLNNADFESRCDCSEWLWLEPNRDC